jgi:hypothetical protein
MNESEQGLSRVAEPRRVDIMERNIVLPIKAALIAIFLYSFAFGHWAQEILTAPDLLVRWAEYVAWSYVVYTVLIAGFVFEFHHLRLSLVRWTVLVVVVVDSVFLAVLSLLSGGHTSFLFWLFPALIVRTAISVPRISTQLLLNCTTTVLYGLTGFFAINAAGSLESGTSLIFGQVADYTISSILVRTGLLLGLTLYCCVMEVLLTRRFHARPHTAGV